MLKKIKKGAFISFHTIRLSLAIVMAFIIVAGGLGLWQLNQKPVDVAFLLPDIQRFVDKKDNNLKISADKIMLSVDISRHGIFHLDIQNFTLSDKNDNVLLDLPQVDCTYGLGQLLTLNYVPTSLQLNNALLQLTVMQNNQVLLSDEMDTSINASSKNAYLIKDIQLVQDRLFAFKFFNIDNSTIIINDKRRHRITTFNDINMAFSRKRLNQFSLTASSGIKVNAHHKIDASINALINKSKETIDIDFAFNNLKTADFAKLSPLFKDINLTLNGSINANLDFSSNTTTLPDIIKKLSFKIATKNGGIVQLPAPLNASYDVASLSASGIIKNNLHDAIITPAQLTLTDGTLADVKITINGLDKAINTRNITDISTILSADMHNIPIKNVPHLWPKSLGTTAHEWVQQNLSKGTLSAAHFDLYFTGTDLSDLFGDIDFTHMTVDYLHPMAKINNVNGKVYLYPNDVNITATSGTINSITLQKGNIALSKLNQSQSYADISLLTNGNVDDVLDLLDSPPLDFVKDFGITPSDTQGTISGTTQLYFPLKKSLKASEVKVDVKANARNALFPLPIDDMNISKGNFAITVDNNGLFVQGTADIAGHIANVSWHEYFYPKNATAMKSFYTFAGDMNHQIFAPFIDVSSYVQGIFDVNAKIIKQKNNDITINADADLKKAGLDFASIVYTKKIDIPATLTTKTSITDNFKNIHLDFNYTSDLKSTIRGSYIKNSDKWALNLDKVQSTESIFSAFIDINKNNDIKATITGKVLNLSNLSKSLLSAKNKETPLTEPLGFEALPVSLDINVSLDRVIINPAAPIEQLSLTLKRDETKWHNLSFLCEGATKTMIQLNNTTGKITGYTKDIGDLVNRFDFSDQLVGGNAMLNATVLESGGFSGVLDMADLHLKKPGFLVQSLTILGLVDAIRGSNLVLDKGKIPFEIAADFKTMIDEGYAYGTTLGITFNGILSPQYVDLTGSVLPAYIINSLLGRIPLIGTLFKDQEGGGLMGAKYTLKGKLGALSLSFNPLSSIAPGIFSKWF